MIDTATLVCFVSSDDDICAVESLPPAYSGLSIRLPPSYSQACRIIYYRPSQEHIPEEHTNVGFENDVPESRIIGYHHSEEYIPEEHTNVGFENDVPEIVLNGFSPDLSNNNVINFPSSSDNTNSGDNIHQ